MSKIYSLYSKRINNESPIDYGPLNINLKNQIWHIVSDFFESIKININLTGIDGHFSRQLITSANERLSEKTQLAWKTIYNILCREHGLEKLPNKYTFISFSSDVEKYFKTLSIIEKELDVLELLCYSISHIGDYITTDDAKINYTRLDAIRDINTRLQENGAGYRYDNDQIIKVPAEFTFIQTIAPSLLIINNSKFKNAQDEFLSAFEHYKNHKYEEAVTDCLKSIESTIKIIATLRNWPFNQNDTAKPLIALVIKEGLVPTYSESFLAGVRNTLESGIPTLRNKLGGHGKGAEARIVDEASMHYCINLTAAVILYLVQRHQELP
ncbi:hypothetical protein E4631_14695 [Hymenobacter sp. UV11]|uniref:STM4504/CBY_0614 family protein n=1 Tax=Hymenobacter sp. UV11 TaxID=1849735 RepID=UPI00105F71B2|nr:hypothetical protein [Hymenobacter sp. UV11]TFZ65479.1 hypothetical protein E4631_14695 [Hymenobacter sp. UV11]